MLVNPVRPVRLPTNRDNQPTKMQIDVGPREVNMQAERHIPPDV